MRRNRAQNQWAEDCPRLPKKMGRGNTAWVESERWAPSSVRTPQDALEALRQAGPQPLPDNRRSLGAARLGVRSDRFTVHAGWTGWMCSLPWQVFWTLTSADRTHPEALEKAIRFIMGEVNRSLYGNHWRRRGTGIQWLVGIERHKSGNPHAHLLAFAPDADLRHAEVFKFPEWRDYATWFLGWNRVEACRSRGDAAAYVTKYVIKDGEIVLSPGFTSPSGLSPSPKGLAAVERRPLAGAPAAAGSEAGAFPVNDLVPGGAPFRRAE